MFFLNVSRLPLKPTYKKSDLNFISDKLDRKLQGLKANLLSKIGRTQLINFTISNLSSHIMKALLFPKSILTKLESKTRCFFWSHSNNARKLNTISWDRITKPKKLGGLGIRSVEHENKVHLLNLLWRLNHSSEKFGLKSLEINMEVAFFRRNQSNLTLTKVYKQLFLYTTLAQEAS